ncbi:MAG: hypothetical protein ABJD11_18095 [Gemmatimonadota bacterium]
MSEPNASDDSVPDGTVTLTTTPIPLSVRPIADERVPDGQVGVAAYLGDRMIARNAFPAEFVEQARLEELFSEPVPLVFHAGVGGPGIEGTLFAVVSRAALEAEEDDAEPWSASVPSFEPVVGEGEEPPQALLPLGMLVRVERDRKFPDDLAKEAADLLQSVLTGKTSEVIDRLLDDLLGT